MEGWANDLSSYANWLYENTKDAWKILNKITDCYNGSEYEDLLRELADKLNDFVSGSACGGSVTLFDISDIFLAELPLANLDTRFTPFSMLRLYADEVEELPKKLLYLDKLETLL